MASEPLIVEQEAQGVLRLKGPLTTENLASFQNAMRRQKTATTFLDLSEVPYMDSAGLGSLLSAYVSRQKAGHRVILAGVNERVLRMFEITRVESKFLIFPSLGDALDSIMNSGKA